MINDNNVEKSVMCNMCLPVLKIVQKRFNLYMGMHAAEFNVLIDIPEYVSTIIDDQITASLSNHIHNDMTDENH